MGNLSTLAREALRQAEDKSITKRILTSRKIICDLEKQPNEVSLRFARIFVSPFVGNG